MVGVRAFGALAALMLAAGGASAEPRVWTWDGYGEGLGKCPGYPMHINVLVEGSRVWGDWQQKDRPMRKFDFKLTAAGEFEGEVPISNGNIVDVKGTVSKTAAEIRLTGYCDFGGKLKPK